MPRPPSIRTVAAAAMVFPVLAAAAVLLVLSGLASRRIAEQLGSTLVASATDRVRADLRAFLAEAVRVSDLYARRIADGALPLDDLPAWEPTELRDLLTTPGIASICFANARADATWVLRAHGRLEIGRADGTRDHEAVEHVIDETGRRTEHIRTYTYDPRQRPWHAAALAADRPLWTPIYFWFGDAGADSETGAGYTRAIRAPDGSLRGVLVIDVTLGALSGFLRALPFAQQGDIFITDDAGLLVAASEGAVNSDTGARLAIAQSPSELARAAAHALHDPAAPVAAERAAHVRIAGSPHRILSTPFNPYPGIAWRIITVIPESAFLGEAAAAERRAIVVSLLAAAGAVALALALSRRFARPLVELAGHARRLGAGEFEARTNVRTARELHELSGELNRMAAGLKERMELRQSISVAMEVQQSLLPQAAPAPPGLDIAGRSRYCDATGGDYYDFIDVAEVLGGRTLVAVGDVMGHGIAAALLMATARAALRAHAAAGVPLGELMGKVNAVLARDARHGRFMTMALLVADPVAGAFRWASAGHDPPIVYDAAKRTFTELEGGDLPLGIMEESAYVDYEARGLSPGSVVVIGTDGIWEAANAAGELFGKPRLYEAIEASAGGTAAQIVAAIDTALTAFVGEARVLDDVTMVVLKFGAGQS